MRTIATSIVAPASPMLVVAQWPAPTAPVVREADGYVTIPKAAVPPDKGRVYKAIFDATRAADKPAGLLPVLNMAGSELNAFGVAGMPLQNAKFAIVFHGTAINGILDEAHYREKFGVSNPNLKVLSQLKKSGQRYLSMVRISPPTKSTREHCRPTWKSPAMR